MVDQVGPRPVVRLVQLRPGAPRVDRRVEHRRQLVLAPHPRRRLVEGRPVQRKVHPLPGPQGLASPSPAGLDGQLIRRRQHQPLRASPRRDAAVDLAEQRDDEAVLRAGTVADLDLHLAGRALDAAHQQVGGTDAEAVAAVVRAERHRVGENERARSGGERGLQDERPVEVAAGALPLGARLDLPVPRVLAEEAAEHRRAVEAREREPVDRPCPGHEGARVPVREQGVVGDGSGGHPGGSDRSRGARCVDRTSRGAADPMWQRGAGWARLAAVEARTELFRPSHPRLTSDAL